MQKKGLNHESAEYLPVGMLVFLDKVWQSRVDGEKEGWKSVRRRAQPCSALIPAVSPEGPAAPFMFEGSLDEAIFAVYAEKSQIPPLPRGSICRGDPASPQSG
jgi:hypothetical protein